MVTEDNFLVLHKNVKPILLITQMKTYSGCSLLVALLPTASRRNKVRLFDDI